MSLGPRPDSDKSEFQTSISLIARVRDRTDVESWREFYQFYHPLLTRVSAAPGAERRSRERRDPGRICPAGASPSQIRV